MNLENQINHLEHSDKKYLWHPFTQMKDWLNDKPIIITEGRNCFLKDISGRWYLDGVSSIWVNIHGHRRKEIDDRIKEQIDKIAHSSLLGLSSVPAIELAAQIVKLTDVSFNGLHPRLTKVFYSDDGSTAVEVALKMAFQYWLHKGKRGKNSFLSLKNAYHGDTIGAMSVGGIDIFHSTFNPLLFKGYKAPSPYCYRCEFNKTYPDCALACLTEMKHILERHVDEIAAVIVEPIVQAAGGIIVSPPGYLKGIRDLCKQYNVLLIADEVATGFGRTGTMFACEHERVSPDILCLSKGLTNGYMPLAATVTTDEIFNSFLGEFNELKTFFHGHSYTGNPLACAAASACIDVFHKEKTLENIISRKALIDDKLTDIGELPHVGNTRAKGLMSGIELVENKLTKKPYPWEAKMGWKVAYYARGKGVIIRPLGNVIVIMPPLSISLQNLGSLMNILKESIIAVTIEG
ncbi:MAG: adenosylmethionine--8-amino-7-oxononanoate transaminase [Dissulfurispiraceae bacterium]